jgi:hypothetical protein
MAFMMTPAEKRKKLDARYTMGLFVGYAQNSKVWRILHWSKGKPEIIETANVRSMEEKRPDFKHLANGYLGDGSANDSFIECATTGGERGTGGDTEDGSEDSHVVGNGEDNDAESEIEEEDHGEDTTDGIADERDANDSGTNAQEISVCCYSVLSRAAACRSGPLRFYSHCGRRE